MTAKEYLKSIRREQKELRILNEKRDTILYDVTLPKGIRYDTIKVQASPKDPMDKLIRVSELTVQIDRLINKLEQRKAHAMNLISKIDKSDYRQVLMLYYLTLNNDGQLMSWIDVAEKMGYSESHIKRIHGWSLYKFSGLYKDDTK